MKSSGETGTSVNSSGTSFTTSTISYTISTTISSAEAENKDNLTSVTNSVETGTSVISAGITPVVSVKMSKETYPPPEFINDASEYSLYKRRLERWTRISKVEKKEQAEVVVYHLDRHPSGIQEKIDTALGDKIIGKDGGMDELIKYLIFNTI